MAKISLPNFRISKNKIPEIRIKSIHFENFKAFGDVNFDFMDGKECKPFICFHGENGSGKTTVLDAVSLIFARYDEREESHLKALLGKSVRHTDSTQRGAYDDNADFLIAAQIHSSLGDYEVHLNKRGFVKDHPQKIKDIIARVCFYAKFDQELHQFQLLRSKWNDFKELFEAVTGFEIEETETLFGQDDKIMKKYVLGFIIHKPNETISHRECSAGERKIIKSFSTLLNKEYEPSIVCIDNAEMHVATERHIRLMESMKKCFSKSQLLTTTHSYQISRNFGKRNQLYDMRLLKSSGIIRKEPWRLYIADEMKDGISKLKSMIDKKITKPQIAIGEDLVEKCLNGYSSDLLKNNCRIFLQNVANYFVEDITTYYGENTQIKK